MYWEIKTHNFFVTTLDTNINDIDVTWTIVITDKIVNWVTLSDWDYLFWILVGLNNPSEMEIFRITNVTWTTLTFDKRISPNGLNSHTSGDLVNINDLSECVNYIADNISNLWYTETVSGSGNELKVKVYWGKVIDTSSIDTTIATTTLTLTDNSTSYIYLDDSDGTFKATTTEPTSYYVVAKVTTLTWAITDITDYRAQPLWVGIIPVTLTTAQRDALTGVRNWTIIYNATTGTLNRYEGWVWNDFGSGSSPVSRLSETVEGKARWATAAEFAAGTDTGTDWAPLVTRPSFVTWSVPNLAYDAIVDAAWTWDYTTVWAALTAGKVNIFVRAWAYTETARDFTWKDVNIVSQWYNSIFTFNNTASHSSAYIISSATSWINIVGWRFNITLNSTNNRFIWGTAWVTNKFNFSDAYLYVSSDDSATRWITYLYTWYDNWLDNCVIELANTANTYELTLANNAMWIKNCYIIWGKLRVITTVQDTVFDNIDYINLLSCRLINCRVEATDLSGNLRYSINTYISATGTSTLNMNGAIGCRVTLKWDITLDRGNADYSVWISYNGCSFFTYWDITLNTGMSWCWIEQCTNFTVSSSNCLITWTRILPVTSLTFDANSDYSAMTACTTANPNKTVIAAGATGVVITWCAHMGSITDEWTDSVIANNS